MKKAMAGKLPPEIAARGKKGFGIPVAKWFRGPLREPLLDRLSEAYIRRQGLFDYPTVARLTDEHLRGIKNNCKGLWTLFMFQTWYESYMNQSPPAAVPRGREELRAAGPVLNQADRAYSESRGGA